MSDNQIEPKKELYVLTEEHKAQFKPWTDLWISRALRTEPQTEEEKEKMRVAMRGMYNAANLEAPKQEVFCASPISAALAACIAAGLWWIRSNPEKAKEHWGFLPTEDIMLRAAHLAVKRGVRAALTATEGPDGPSPETLKKATQSTWTAVAEAVGASTVP